MFVSVCEYDGDDDDDDADEFDSTFGQDRASSYDGNESSNHINERYTCTLFKQVNNVRNWY